jgi:hypothetical protein
VFECGWGVGLKEEVIYKGFDGDEGWTNGTKFLNCMDNEMLLVYQGFACSVCVVCRVGLQKIERFNDID